ncbi:replication protein [Priestia aryabhattai]|uniref:replication protein n=1 Tax=Priestia aryabhattai TaxID=412384 RepID=UPI000B511222|nr:replication protein [Priestia aryabhattai]OVE34257.1 replication protein [Priestia aryabhattai]
MEGNIAIELAKHHVLFQHHGADGWVTVAKRENGKFRQYHYKPDDLALKLSEWLGEDVYFSQNTFYKPARSIENIRQLRALYVDIDFYILNYDYNWILGNIDLLIDDRELPNPNLIINSGRGVVCVWLIESVPSKALPLWQAVQKDFFRKLERFGGDSKASDAARVFRIAGSINSKNGEAVTVNYRHEERYILRELQEEYLPDLKPKNVPSRKGRRSKVQNLYNSYSLHHARLMDLVKLVELRSYDVKGFRETILFLYRYWKCCFLNDTDRALEETLAFNAQFVVPLPKREAIRATKSAEKAWSAKNDEEADRIAREKGYPGAGYNISNKKLIDWLDINAEEMQQLSTIIDANEKRRRKRIANEKMRREQGMKTMKEYNEERKEQTEDKLWQLQKAMERHPKAKRAELAEMLGLSVYRIDQLKRKLKSL